MSFFDRFSEFNRMSIEELHSVMRDLDAKKQEIIDKKKYVAKFLHEKEERLETKRKLLRFSEQERQRVKGLLQEIKAEGIDSDGDIGIPGA